MPDAPAFQYADLPQQHDAASLGMWVFLATEMLFFGGLFLAYGVYRFADPEGFAAAARETHIVIGTTNTALLLTSSFLVAWGVAAARTGLGRMAAALFLVAAAIGLGFLVLKGLEYRAEYAEHRVPGIAFEAEGPHAGAMRLFFSFYFVATGLHALHMLVGIGVLGAIARRAAQGAYNARYHAPATVAALYWHFVDAVWIVLFALIYLPGRAA